MEKDKVKTKFTIPISHKGRKVEKPAPLVNPRKVERTAKFNKKKGSKR